MDDVPKRKDAVLKCPTFLTMVVSHDRLPSTLIFLPFPKRNAIFAGIKTKAKTNLLGGNFKLFTCQTEFLEMPN